MTGPHQDRKLELMLAGTKPAALFYDVEPDGIGVTYCSDDFAPHVATGRIKEFRFEHRRPTGEVASYLVVDALPGEEWRAQKLFELQDRVYSEPAWDLDWDVEIGRLLGYPEEDVLDYPRRWREFVASLPGGSGS